jgi:Zn-dependent peptidase ImmA (M78 family)
MEHSGTAENWLQTTFGPGTIDDIIMNLAWTFWEHSGIIHPKNINGRIISGQTLLEWGKIAGFKKIVSPRLKRRQAYVTPCHGGFQLSISAPLIKNKSYKDAVRLVLEKDYAKRWMFAHEMGHTLFYDKSYDPPIRIYGLEDESGEELLCQQFAAELLLPYKQLKIYSLESQITIESLISLTNLYGVPLRAVIRRLHNLGILQATCVIIKKTIADSWAKRCYSRNPLPQRGIEIFEPKRSNINITEEQLFSDKVVYSVCSSETYWNSELCCVKNDNSLFVEGMMLSKIPPCKARILLFHKTRPIFQEKLLFDNIVV